MSTLVFWFWKPWFWGTPHLERHPHGRISQWSQQRSSHGTKNLPLPAVTGTLSPLLHLGAKSSHPVDSRLRGDDFITAFCGTGFTNLSLSHSLYQNLSPLIGKHQVHLPRIPISTSNSFLFFFLEKRIMISTTGPLWSLELGGSGWNEFETLIILTSHSIR